MSTVFISYDREDSDFAELVQAKLHRADHTTFMDLEILNAGDDWRDKIDLTLRACQVLIVIMMPEAAASHYVAYEWAFALGAGVKVIPLELRTTELHPRLVVLQRILFTDKARPWQKLLEEVQKVPDLTLKDTVWVAETAPPVVKKAVGALDSLDPDEQKRAVVSLAQMNHPSAYDALIAALQHPAKNVRVTAAFEAALARVEDPRILVVLLEAVRDNWNAEHISHYTTRLNFEDIAVNIGPAAVPILIGALSDGDSDVRRSAVNALGEIGDVAVIPDLIQALNDQAYGVRFAAIFALKEIGGPAAIPGFIQALRDSDREIRLQAISALANIDDPIASASLRDVLEDPIEDVRCAAAKALGKLKDKSALPELLKHLREDPRAAVRGDAASAIGQIGDSTAVPDLLDALKSQSWYVRRAAVVALGQIGDPVAITELRGSLADDDADVRCGAGEALILLKDETSVSKIADAVIRSGRRDSSISVVRALEEMGEAAVPALAEILAKNPSLGTETAEVLKRVGSKEALDAVRKWEFQP